MENKNQQQSKKNRSKANRYLYIAAAAVLCLGAILTGVVVSVSGVIGFVGLVVPHIMRSFVGSGHKRLIPVAILAGGLFSMVADLISRIIIAPEELPIGVIAAFIGAPFFLYLIRKGSAGRK